MKGSSRMFHGPFLQAWCLTIVRGSRLKVSSYATEHSLLTWNLQLGTRNFRLPHVIPCVLTIAGLDPSGGAGLPADARACAAFGAHALPVATAVIAQNTCGVALFE